MKTLALLLTLFLVVLGVKITLLDFNSAGVVLIIVGALAFLIINNKTKKIAGYNPNSFMNR